MEELGLVWVTGGEEAEVDGRDVCGGDGSWEGWDGGGGGIGEGVVQGESCRRGRALRVSVLEELQCCGWLGCVGWGLDFEGFEIYLEGIQ